MLKSVSYVCNLCNTLLHNNPCACNNAATIVSKDGKSIQLFVDDLTTVTTVNTYITSEGKVVRLDYFTPHDTIVETGLSATQQNYYIKSAKAFETTSQYTNQQTAEHFNLAI